MNEFPSTVLPGSIVEFVEGLHSSDGLFPDYTYAAILSVSAAAIGTSTCIREGANRWVYPNIWTVIIGDSGVKKSPSIREASRPLHKYHKSMYELFISKKQSYTDDEDAPKPACERLIVDDTTIEGLAKAFLSSPFGILMEKQELKGLFNDFNRYNKGSDRQRYLTIYDGDPLYIDRKGADPLDISQPWLSILGSVQWNTIAPFISTESLGDGLAYRFDYVCPSRVHFDVGDGQINQSSQDTYERIIDRLMQLRVIAGENSRKVNLSYTHEARAIRDHWLRKKLAPAINELDSADPLRGYRAKQQGKFTKYCIILQCIKDAANARIPCEIEFDTARDAILLLNYFEAQFSRLIERNNDTVKSNEVLLRSFYKQFRHAIDKEELISYLHGLSVKGHPDKQIREAFDIAKGTLSGWLKPYRS